MKIAESLGMTKIKNVSLWYTLSLVALLVPALAHAQAPIQPVNRSGIVTGYDDGKNAPPPILQPNYQGVQPGLSSPPMPPRMFVPDEKVAYPNIGEPVTEDIKSEVPEVANPAIDFLKNAMSGIGQGDYKRPAQSGYSAPGPDGSQYYYYNPNGAENDAPVDNDFPTTCNENHQTIPLNPKGLTASELAGKRCTPYADRLTCMVCNLFHEAANEPAAGQLAVARNVMTRVFNGKFPDTVCKVVWEYKQYSWTLLYKGDRLNLPHNTAKIQQLMDVAKAGMCQGPSGKTNYYNPSIASPAWGGGQCEKTKQIIANHKFCTIGSGAQTKTIAQVAAAEGLKPLIVGDGSRSPAAAK